MTSRSLRVNLGRHSHIPTNWVKPCSIFNDISRGLVENWPIWVVTITLVVAAVIDGLQAEGAELDHVPDDHLGLDLQRDASRRTPAGKG